MSYNVNVQVGLTPASASVLVTPQATQNTTSAEATAFGIDGDNLKTLWQTQIGDWPDDANLAGDRFTDGRPPTQTVYNVISSQVVSVTPVTEAAATAKFTNNTRQIANFQPTLTASTSNTVESSTTATQTVGVTQTIKYGISFLGTGGGGETALNYSYTWAEEQSQSTTNTWQLSAAASVPVDPGETIVANMMIQNCKMVVQIVYELALTGLAEANFSHRVNDHYIWFHDINDLLNISKKPTTITVTETMTLDFYAAAEIVMSDGSGSVVVVPKPIGMDKPHH